MKLLFHCVLWIAFLSTCAVAEDRKGTKVTVLVRGAHCEACVQQISRRLQQAKGLRFTADDLQPGESPRYFSDPFELEIGNSLRTGIGAVGKAVAGAPSPHRSEVPPRLHLVLYTDYDIEEETVSRMRDELLQVNGVAVNEGGGLGGIPRKKLYWIRIEPAGGAELNEILEAAKKAADVRLLKR